jgi:hypothetical protein
MTDLIARIENLLRRNPSRMYSKEEILNLLAREKKDAEIENYWRCLKLQVLSKKVNPIFTLPAEAGQSITNGTAHS